MVKESKNNRLGLVASATGGHNVVHDTKTGDQEIKTPPATPVDPPQLGLAKASPMFKKVEPKAKATKTDEERALKENETKTEGNVSISPQNEHTTPPTT